MFLQRQYKKQSVADLESRESGFIASLFHHPFQSICRIMHSSAVIVFILLITIFVYANNAKEILASVDSAILLAQSMTPKGFLAFINEFKSRNRSRRIGRAGLQNSISLWDSGIRYIVMRYEEKHFTVGRGLKCSQDRVRTIQGCFLSSFFT